MLNSFLQHLLVVYKLLHFLIRVFTRKFLKHLQALSQIFIFVLELENFTILLVYQL